MIFNIVLAVDAYVPEVEPLNVLSAVNGAAHIPGSPLPVLEPGDEITYQLDIRNIGSEAVNGAKVVIPIPYTTEYVSAGPYSKDNSVTGGALQPVYDPITSTLTWDLGNLPWTANPDPTNTLDIQTILASMTYTLKVTEDCMFLSNAECIPVVEVKGRVEGTGAVSGVTLGGGGDFISGYNENVDCEQDPIRDPITLAIDVGDHCDDYTVESIEFKFCEGEIAEGIEVEKIRGSFPVGIRFYDTTDKNIEYTNANPFPNEGGNFVAIPPGNNEECFFYFTLTITVIEDAPAPINEGLVEYCVDDVAVPLVVEENTEYDLIYYITIDGAGSTVPITPSTDEAGEFTYWVAYKSGQCIGPKAEITVIVSERPAAPISGGDLIACEDGSEGQTLDARDAIESVSGISVAWFDEGGAPVTTPTLVGVGTVTYYAVSVADGDNGCSSVDSTAVTLTITAAPAAPISSGDLEECLIDASQILDANDALDLKLLEDNVSIVWCDAVIGGAIVDNPVQTDLGTITYYAESVADNGEGCTSISRTPVTLTISNCSIAVVKTYVFDTEEDCAVVGDEVVYTFVVHNTGNVDLTNIALSDVLEGAVVNPVLTDDGNGDAVLNVGESWTYTYEHTITQDDLNRGSITNQATVTGTAPNEGTVSDISGSTIDSDDATVVELCQDANIALVKSYDLVTEDDCYDLKVGDVIAYKFEVYNRGNVDLRDIDLTDEMEGLSSITLISGDENADLILNVEETWIYTATYTVTQADVNRGFIVNNAVVKGLSHTGTPVTDKSGATIDSDEELVITICQSAGIAVAQAHNQLIDDCVPLEVGDEIGYTFTVHNVGNVDITSVLVAGDLEGLSPVAMLLSSDDNLDGILNPEEDWIFNAIYTVTQADLDRGYIMDIATSLGTWSLGEVQAESGSTRDIYDNTLIVICQEPALSLEKSANKETVKAVGEEIVYTITVTNTGNRKLSDVSVSDEMLDWSTVIEELDPGVSKEFALTYVVTQEDIDAGLLLNVAVASHPDVPVDPTDEVEIPVDQNPALSLDKSVNKETVKTVGEEVIYTIKVTNTGNVTLSDVSVSDEMLDWSTTIETLKVGETKDFSLTYVVTQEDIAGGEIVNIVSASHPDIEEEPTDEVTVKVDHINNLSVEKTADKEFVDARDQVITYTIRVKNMGNQPLHNVAVSDPLTGLEEMLEVLGVDEGKVYITTYVVQREDLSKSEILNTVEVQGTNPQEETVRGNDHARVEVRIPDLFIPNVFTPNGDGVNDVFEIVGIESFDKVEITIINRWGNEVYRNDNYKNTWDGKGVNDGTYYYIIVTHKGGQRTDYKGWVLVKRY